MSDRPWTPAEDEYAVKLWTEGKSAREISLAIRSSFKITRSRSSVIGRLHRKGLSRAQQGPRNPRAYATYKPSRTPRVPKKSPVIASLGFVPSTTGIDYKLTAATADQREACRRNGVERVAWVESGAGVVSPNARPFLEATGCRWPLAGGLMCCNPKGRREYCAGHAAVAFERATKGPKAEVLTRHDGVVDKYREAGPESTQWDAARLAA